MAHVHGGRRRAICLATLGFAIGGAAACAKRVELGDVGTSHVAPEAPSGARSPKPEASGPWEHTRELAGLVAIDSRAIPSIGHHPPSWTGQVRVSPGAASLYRDPPPGSAYAEGTILTESHATLEGAALPTYAMVKRESGFDGPGGDWEYLVLESDGSIVSRGVLQTCARCHADAPGDHAFGPRGPSRSAAVAPTPAQSAGSTIDDEARAPDESDGPASPTKGKPPTGKKKR